MTSNAVPDMHLHQNLPSASCCNSVPLAPLQLACWLQRPIAQARITKITITSQPGTIAFGGYSFPGVGQYELITGIATGEVNPSSPQNAVITDINSPRKTNGNVGYQHNFYILKPLDLRKGNHKMMYEPPNRGGKTYQTLNNTPPAPTIPLRSPIRPSLANSFLWTRGYTTVWSGWENNLDPKRVKQPDGDRDVAGRARLEGRRSPGRLMNTS